MASPPLLAGAVHDTLAWELPAVAATPVGAPGTVRGVTPAVLAESVPVSIALMAATRNQYVVPFTRPVTVLLVTFATVTESSNGPTLESSDHWMRYPVIALPPSLGADQVRPTCAFPGVDEPMVGAPGAVGAVTVRGADALEGRDVPPALVAVAVNV